VALSTLTDHFYRNMVVAETVMKHVSSGRHLLHIEVMNETADPGGGHDFRITGVASN
jgi:hypothetical protein